MPCNRDQFGAPPLKVLPRFTVIVPSFNHARFLGHALDSLRAQGAALETFVMDGASSDGTAALLASREEELCGWTSAPDAGQAAAINEGMKRGSAPFVAWLNADDELVPGGLERLAVALEDRPSAPFAYGRAELIDEAGRVAGEYKIERFDRDRFARRCFICQPAVLIRRGAWEAVGGLRPHLRMALDYDIWWRLLIRFGEPVYVDAIVARTRVHWDTKTIKYPLAHYREALSTVREHYGTVPLLWYAKMPVSVLRRWVASARGI